MTVKCDDEADSHLAAGSGMPVMAGGGRRAINEGASVITGRC